MRPRQFLTNWTVVSKGAPHSGEMHCSSLAARGEPRDAVQSRSDQSSGAERGRAVIHIQLSRAESFAERAVQKPRHGARNSRFRIGVPRPSAPRPGRSRGLGEPVKCGLKRPVGATGRLYQQVTLYPSELRTRNRRGAKL